jgi:hypothetical protein
MTDDDIIKPGTIPMILKHLDKYSLVVLNAEVLDRDYHLVEPKRLKLDQDRVCNRKL